MGMSTFPRQGFKKFEKVLFWIRYIAKKIVTSLFHEIAKAVSHELKRI